MCVSATVQLGAKIGDAHAAGNIKSEMIFTGEQPLHDQRDEM